MAPRCLDGAAPVQPQSAEAAALEELQEVIEGFETQAASIIERLARENEALRAQLTAAKAVAAVWASDAPPSAALDGGGQGVVVGADWKQGDGGNGSIQEAFRASPPEELEAVMVRSGTSQVYSSGPTPREEELLPVTTPPQDRRGSKSSLESYGMRSMGSMRSLNSDAPLLHRLVRGVVFESFMSICILLNCVTVGIWAHQLVTNEFDQTVVDTTDVMEHCFVAFFLIELALKVRAFGLRSYRFSDPATRGNFFDAMLVIVTGLMFTWLLPIAGLIFGFDPSGGPLKTLTVLRTVRLARLVRVFQRAPLFREAWMLIRGLSDSSRTLFWTCVVIFLVTYVFAIVGVATIVVELQALRAIETDPAEMAVLDELIHLMGGLDRLMATLVQVLLGDSFHTFTRECNRFIWWSWIYFYCYISIAVVVLMNLVTAIIVENAMETSKADHDHVAAEKEAKKKKDIEMLRRLFKTLDTDGGGTLSWEEFETSFDDPELARTWMVLDFGREDCHELFQLLDDGDGEITISEFLDALFRMSGTAQSKDVFRLQKSVEKIQHAIDDAHSKTDGAGD